MSGLKIIATGGQIKTHESAGGRFIPCAVTGCIVKVKLGKDSMEIALCTYHFGRAPRHIKAPLQRAAQKKDTALISLTILDVIKYWADKK